MNLIEVKNYYNWNIETKKYDRHRITFINPEYIVNITEVDKPYWAIKFVGNHGGVTVNIDDLKRMGVKNE